MASTYSNLKIQLMGTGENSGTWGTVTNVNLGTAIEEAIVGSADVTFSSADVTLTLTDSNATQTARNLRLNLIGVSGGARQLIVPAIEKVYIINNGLADTVTVKNSTGNGIAVPAGKTMWVYNTGSNVVDATTHLTSLTLGTPLAVAQGGTGTNTGINLQNGSLVSGVLPIANGGTNSSTGVNVETALVFGTLPVSKGGTGLNTLTSEAVIVGNATGEVKFVSPGTVGNVLTSTGTAWGSSGITTITATTGNAPYYAARSWGVCDSSGALRASANMSSSSRITTGTFRFNFTTNMADDNYAATINASTGIYQGNNENVRAVNYYQITTAQFLLDPLGGFGVNPNYVQIAIFR